jgi:CDP-diacylglycerol---glycerol-3-phosphate 3-phosphatidyltransferase
MNSQEDITIFDKFWAATILKLFPKSLRPNHLTVVRFILIPFVVLLLCFENYYWGLGVFTLAALTDTWDGAMARTRNQITEWGKAFDPLADKLLIGSTALLIVPIYLSFKVVMVILALEVMLVGEAIYLKKYKHKDIQAASVGKIKMVLQSFGVGFLLFHLIFPFFWVVPLATALIYISIGFAFASLVVYRSI